MLLLLLLFVTEFRCWCAVVVALLENNGFSTVVVEWSCVVLLLNCAFVGSLFDSTVEVLFVLSLFVGLLLEGLDSPITTISNTTTNSNNNTTLRARCSSS